MSIQTPKDPFVHRVASCATEIFQEDEHRRVVQQIFFQNDETDIFHEEGRGELWATEIFQEDETSASCPTDIFKKMKQTFFKKKAVAIQHSTNQ